MSGTEEIQGIHIPQVPMRMAVFGTQDLLEYHENLRGVEVLDIQ